MIGYSFGWRRFLVTAPVIAATEELLRSYWKGRTRQEGIVYWGGRSAGQDIIAICAFAPKTVSTPGSVSTTEDANSECVLGMKRLDLIHVAQVHSHPPGANFHSDGDSHWAFMKHQGLVSIVALEYGSVPLWPLKSVHVFDGSKFVQLSLAEIASRFLLVPSWVEFRERRRVSPKLRGLV